jgi:PleD family two-component response regulator
MAILDQTPVDKSAVVAERLCSVARLLKFDELAAGFRISISIGGADYRKPEDWQATVERADQALYRAKHAGRDRFELAISSGEGVVQGT